LPLALWTGPCKMAFCLIIFWWLAMKGIASEQHGNLSFTWRRKRKSWCGIGQILSQLWVVSRYVTIGVFQNLARSHQIVSLKWMKSIICKFLHSREDDYQGELGKDNLLLSLIGTCSQCVELMSCWVMSLLMSCYFLELD
jgi:hypothetical protein